MRFTNKRATNSLILDVSVTRYESFDCQIRQTISFLQLRHDHKEFAVLSNINDRRCIHACSNIIVCQRLLTRPFFINIPCIPIYKSLLFLISINQHKSVKFRIIYKSRFSHVSRKSGESGLLVLLPTRHHAPIQNQ